LEGASSGEAVEFELLPTNIRLALASLWESVEPSLSILAAGIKFSISYKNKNIMFFSTKEHGLKIYLSVNGHSRSFPGDDLTRLRVVPEFNGSKNAVSAQFCNCRCLRFNQFSSSV